MAGEVTEAVKASVGCLFWMAVISVALTIGYFVLNIILYLITVVLAIAIGLAVRQQLHGDQIREGCQRSGDQAADKELAGHRHKADTGFAVKKEDAKDDDQADRKVISNGNHDKPPVLPPAPERPWDFSERDRSLCLLYSFCGYFAIYTHRVKNVTAFNNL